MGLSLTAAQEAGRRQALPGDLQGLRGRGDVDSGSESLCEDSRGPSTNGTGARGAEVPGHLLPGVLWAGGPWVAVRQSHSPVSRGRCQGEVADTVPLTTLSPAALGVQGALTSSRRLRPEVLRDPAHSPSRNVLVLEMGGCGGLRAPARPRPALTSDVRSGAQREADRCPRMCRLGKYI